MSDEKISQLPDATLPLSGSELVPLVQGGANVKTAVSNVRQVVATPTIETSSFSAAAGGIYHCQTSAGAMTATLNASPSQWDEIVFVDTSGNANTNPVTIALNGNNYQGGSSNPTLSLPYEMLKIQFNGSQWVQVP